MCGIIGRIGKKLPVKDINFLHQKLTHRGPDDCGIWRSEDGRIQLAHTRLAINDLSQLGHQPMSRDAGRYVIIFNGEIYNHNDLRKQLESLGHQFISKSDTEVILAAYQTWGVDCVLHFNGMFAFAILDQGDKNIPPCLFLARDRVGEKPLYYQIDSQTFQFSSELKAIEHRSSLNLNSLNYYLALGYVPQEMCLYEGVAKLSPAHCAKYMIDTGEFSTWRYWSLPLNSSNESINTFDLSDMAGVLIEDSVRLRLSADVPVGILLSGGLDSSLVAAAAARVSTKAIETFTIALPGSSMDESEHAKKVSSYLGTNHHVLDLSRPSLSLLDGLAPFIDEPIADSSILPAWVVFGLAKKHVTVALGGDGGDELFGGYTNYLSSINDLNKLKFVPAKLMHIVGKCASILPAGVRGRNRLASLREGALKQTIWGGPYFDSVLRKRLLSRDAVHCLGNQMEAPEFFLSTLFGTGSDAIDCLTRMDFGSILPDDFLVKIDRASMAHSIEVRAPLLDHRLVEFCFGKIPSCLKVGEGESRRLQRILASKWLPPDLDTRRKQGFSIPINEWLRVDGERSLMARLESLPSLFNMDEIHKLVRGHIAGRANGGRLFSLIMLAIAMRNNN